MGFAHLTLATRDLDKSREFFAATLGWKPMARPGNVESKGAWLRIAPGQELHLNQVDDLVPPPHEDEFGRHIALEFPASHFASLKSRLIEHGAELVTPRRETPFKRFFFRDPNGYLFEIVDANRIPESPP